MILTIMPRTFELAPRINESGLLAGRRFCYMYNMSSIDATRPDKYRNHECFHLHRLDLVVLYTTISEMI